MSVVSADLDLLFGFRTEALLDGPPEAKEKMLDAIRKHEAGHPFPQDVVPDTLFAWRAPHDSSKPLTRKLPHLSSCGGVLVATSEAADVLRRFDLGGCKLHPIEVLMEDRRTPLPGSYFLLDFDSWKDVFLPDQSPGFPNRGGASGMWMASVRAKDDAAALSAAALDGADIWWNARIWRGFFLSDRLVQALRTAKLDKPFSLRRCRIL